MKGADVSFLREQQSRLIPAQPGTQARWNFTFYGLDSRLCGNDTLDLGRRTAGCFIRLIFLL
jgi:hypothetical protein